MLGQIGSISEFALVIVANVLTLCTVIYIILMPEKTAKSAVRTCFRLQLPTLILLMLLTAALLGVNLRAQGRTAPDLHDHVYGFPMDAVSVSSSGRWDVRGWDLLMNLSTAFGLAVPLLIGCEIGLRRRRRLNFEPALQTAMAGGSATTELLRRSDSPRLARPVSQRTTRSARWRAAPEPRKIRRYPLTLASALLLLGMLLWLKQAWQPWVVERSFAAQERSWNMPGVTAIAFLPDGRHLIAASDEATVTQWDLHATQPVAHYIGNTAIVKSVVLSEQARFFTTQSSDGMARLWNTETAAEVQSFGRKATVTVTAIAAAPTDLGNVLVGYSDDSVRLYTVGGHLERTLLGHPGKLSWVRFLPGEQSAICANWRGAMQLWDTAQPPIFQSTQALDLEYDGVDCAKLWGTNDIVLKGDTSDLIRAFHPESSPWLMTIAHHGRVAQWSVATGREIRNVPDELPGTVSAACTDDGKTLVTTDESNRWQEWRFEPNATLPSHASEVRTAVVSSDRTQFVTASRDGTARVWDARSGRERTVFNGNAAGLLMARFTPDGRRVVTLSDAGAVRVFDTETQDEVLSLAGDTQTNRAAAISSDGQRALFVHADGTVRVCGLNPARELGALPSQTHSQPGTESEAEFTVAEFVPGSHEILAGRHDGTMQLWNRDFEWPGGLLKLWQFGAACWLALLALTSAYFERRNAARYP